MTNEIVQAGKFDQDQIDLIKRMVAKDATDDELKLFLYQAQRTGLDPLARQIVFQKFKSKDGKSNVSIITTVDGYRLIADRTDRYAGSDDYRFDEGLTEYNHITADRGIYPTTATVTVYKIVAGQRAPFTSTARWEEYYPGDGGRGFMWRKMPYLMLGKCAEALSLRKAFPAELSGLYTREEMEQAEVFDVQATEIHEPEPEPVKTKKVKEPQQLNDDGGIFKEEPIPVKSDRSWDGALVQALVREGLAAHPKHGVGMLNLSNLAPDATEEQVIAWGRIYRGQRDADVTSEDAIKLANAG